MNKGRLTSLVRLSYLGPEIVRALLVGSQSNALTPSRLLRLSKNLPHDWKEQRCFLAVRTFDCLFFGFQTFVFRRREA